MEKSVLSWRHYRFLFFYTLWIRDLNAEVTRMSASILCCVGIVACLEYTLELPFLSGILKLLPSLSISSSPLKPSVSKFNVSFRLWAPRWSCKISVSQNLSQRDLKYLHCHLCVIGMCLSFGLESWKIL